MRLEVLVLSLQVLHLSFWGANPRERWSNIFILSAELGYLETTFQHRQYVQAEPVEPQSYCMLRQLEWSEPLENQVENIN